MSGPHVRAETRTVFVGGGRGFLTKNAAYRAAAKAMIRAKCECEPFEHDTGHHYECGYHRVCCADMLCEHPAKLREPLADRIEPRLVRFLRFVDHRRAAVQESRR